jgi:hypothetical protein
LDHGEEEMRGRGRLERPADGRPSGMAEIAAV